MKRDQLLLKTFVTSTPPSGNRPPAPLSTLAHLYGHVQAQSNSTMWRPQARPPLAHARSIKHEEGSVQAQLHSQYSMIAVVVLTALFFTITLLATGLLLAFCKKTNTVFSLQKSEQDSNYELDDLEKSEAESRNDDNAAGDCTTPRHREQRRSRTMPDLAGADARQTASTDASYLAKSADRFGAGSSNTTGASRPNPQSGETVRTDGQTSSPVKRSVTVAAIHHSSPPASTVGECCVTIHVHDVDTKSDTSDTAFDHLYLKLHEEEEEEEEGGEGVKDDDNEYSDVDDVHNDQTRALLKS
ncbi:hypothetical protein ACOMHN_022404 [Nucella lapillus]